MRRWSFGSQILRLQSTAITLYLFYQLISRPLTDMAGCGFDKNWHNRISNKSVAELI